MLTFLEKNGRGDDSSRKKQILYENDSIDTGNSQGLGQIVHLNATPITEWSVQSRAGYVIGFPKTAASRQCPNLIPDTEKENNSITTFSTYIRNVKAI